MNQTEQMAKLRSIITGDSDKREQLDEMFTYGRDNSPAGQRSANKPQDALNKRSAVKNPIIQDPKGYKGMMKGTAKIFGTTAKDVYKMHGPKGPIPEEDMGANNELQTLMKKYGVMEEGACNMTAEGEECPVHGLEECGVMEEGNDSEMSVQVDFDKGDLSGHETKFGVKIDPISSPDEGKRKVTGSKDALKKYLNVIHDSGFSPVNVYPEVFKEDEDLDEAEGKKSDFLDVDGDGDKKEPMKKALKDKAKKVDESDEEELEESINITLDGPEADEMIRRLMMLAGQTSEQGGCQTCGTGECECGSNGSCDACGSPGGKCCCDDVTTMENADYDFGHQTTTKEGDPVDFKTWEPEQDPQRFVKSPGDNSLIKENSNRLFAKLKGDYKAYISEAELARSNTGTDSPLTATNRDEFEKDPFAGEEPDTSGESSPLTNIKRQKVSR